MRSNGFQSHVLELPDLSDVISISLRGRISYHDAPELRKALVRELSKTWASRVVIELGRVEAIDTAGVAGRVEVRSLGKQRKRQVLFCTPSDSVVRIFRLSGLEDVLEACCRNPTETRERLAAESC